MTFINFVKSPLDYRIVFPSLPLDVSDSAGKDINKVFANFVWINKHHHLKKTFLFAPKGEDGFELLDWI